MKLFISDLHFFHRNLNTKMDMRGFEDEFQMNEYIIERWNKKVTNKDEVYILGDFSFGDAVKTQEVLDRLKGRLYLIKGNHEKYLDFRRFDTSRFIWVKDYEEIHDNKRKIILSHYPIMCYNGQYRFDGDNNPKTYMLYGHVHNTYDEVLINNYINMVRNSKKLMLHTGEEDNIPCNMINCFCMFSDYQPLTLDEWIEVDRERREKMNSSI
ncbi:MAG: metallophosphoesterase family protein [Lachnospiraceae bacterium]|nr:metallophosphoesterase family protein [Lachnospiraceae bacterium]